MKIIITLLVSILITTSSFAKLHANVPRNVIGMNKAKSIALKAAPGQIKSSELEYEKKHWVYSFDIASNQNEIREILVNARTGKILSNNLESAAREKQEANENRKIN